MLSETSMPSADTQPLVQSESDRHLTFYVDSPHRHPQYWIQDHSHIPRRDLEVVGD